MGKEPKWSLNEAIESGKKSVILATTYKTNISPRLETDELSQHEANVTELGVRRSGQKQNLSDQKSKTGRQEEVILQVNAEVVGLRDMVRSKNPSVEIAEAFGIGNRIILTVGGVTAAANVLIDGYKKFPAWAKKAGIIDTDITKLTGLVTSLGLVEKLQDDSMFTRKAKTMGKDELQRAVEDEVTSLSAIGAYVFHDVDPAISRLFEDLIPSSGKEKDEEKPEPTATNA